MQMSKAHINLQRRFAKNAGTFDSTDETWQAMYDHHLGIIEHPLPFGTFRRKMILLDSYLKRDPEGKDRSLDRNILHLSNELGV